MIYEMDHIWTADMKSSEAMIFAIPVRRSNQLSYEATDVMNWSFVRSSVPVRNESTMIYHFIVDSFFTGTLEPRNEFKFRIRIKHEQQKRIPPPPPSPRSPSLLVKEFFLL